MCVVSYIAIAVRLVFVMSFSPAPSADLLHIFLYAYVPVNQLRAKRKVACVRWAKGQGPFERGSTRCNTFFHRRMSYLCVPFRVSSCHSLVRVFRLFFYFCRRHRSSSSEDSLCPPANFSIRKRFWSFFGRSITAATCADGNRIRDEEGGGWGSLCAVCDQFLFRMQVSVLFWACLILPSSLRLDGVGCVLGPS